jgi:hypothetical protein
MTERLADLAIREVVELHDFFCAWLRPAAANGPQLDPARFERVLDPEFRLVGPDGRVRERATIVAWLHDLRGGRGADFTMQVSDFTPVWQQGDAILLEYVETQYLHGKTTQRHSTALLRRAPESPAGIAPAGIAWVHLQETWLQTVD